MAQVITVKTGDSISKILKHNRGLKEHEVALWLPIVRRINPHISNLDHIYPQEKVLVPKRLDEAVSDTAIWQNVYDHIPSAFFRNKDNINHLIHLCIGAESIDDVARDMFIDTPYAYLRLSAKRALLLHNNPYLRKNLFLRRIPSGESVDITLKRFSGSDHTFWTGERPHINDAWNQLDETTKQVVMDVGSEDSITMVDLIQRAKDMGASVGPDEALRFGSYGVAGSSGYAASGEIALSNIEVLAREIYEDAIVELGDKVVHSKRQVHLIRMQQFLIHHSKYKDLMRAVKDLPKYLLPKGRLVPNTQTGGPVAAARHFRKAFSLPYNKWNASRYLSAVGRQLNGKVQLVKGVGRHATWYIPAAIGVYTVIRAPAELRIRTAFEEGVSVVGGVLGTWIGGVVIGASLASLLCLGPLGVFVVMFFFGSVGGIALSNTGKWLGGRSYDIGNTLSNQIFYSIDDLLGTF